MGARRLLLRIISLRLWLRVVGLMMLLLLSSVHHHDWVGAFSAAVAACAVEKGHEETRAAFLVFLRLK